MFMEISEDCFLGKYTDASKKLMLCEDNIQATSLKMTNFSQNPDYKPYGNTVAAINLLCCDLLCIMHEIIKYAFFGILNNLMHNA